MKGRLAFCSVACLAAAALTRAQAPPLSAEFQVNTSTTGYQYASGVSADAAGNFVVAWESNVDHDADIDARLYDANGSPITGAFRVNTYTTGYQAEPSIAMGPAGDFIVTWSGLDETGAAGTDIFARRYDANGSPAGDEFLVNAYTTGLQDGPAIAVDAGGDFVVVWQSEGQDGDMSGIFGRVFDATGSPMSEEFQVNQYTTGAQTGARVAYGGNGNFVVVWNGGYDGGGVGVSARRFDPSGNPVSDEFTVNAYTPGDQYDAAVAADGAGGFVVTWASSTGLDADIFARRFGSAGQPLGDDIAVNTYTTNLQFRPRIGMDRQGNFLIAWESQDQDGSEDGIFAQRFDPSGARIGDEFQVNTTTTGDQTSPAVAVVPDGQTIITWGSNASGNFDVIARRAAPIPVVLLVDTPFSAPEGAALNGVLEPGETVFVAPHWTNDTPSPLPLTGTASNFTGPAGATYALVQAAADYGTIAPGQTAGCASPGACYSMGIDDPAVRPAAHWDATFDEDLSSGGRKTWTVHVGESFSDVADAQQFYAFIENLFHNGVTGGCGGGNYCPTSSVTRDQMAIFLLKSKHGSSFVPPPCTGVFPDVPCPSPFADWIEELFHEGITAGCAGGGYCPGNPVTRQQMAVFLLKAEHGSSYAPPGCVGSFGDVPCPSQFADWIEQLSTEGITGGCGGGNYCPTSPNTRGQMAVFLVKTFNLLLDGP